MKRSINPCNRIIGIGYTGLLQVLGFCSSFFHIVCQAVLVRYTEPELVAPHLESALHQQLLSRFVRFICSATSALAITGETPIPST